MLRLAAFVLLLALTPHVAWAQEILQNDTAGRGDEVGIHPGLQDEEGFQAKLDVPEEMEWYKICRLLVWVGPRNFNVFELRIAEVDEEGGFGPIVWFSDLDAYQMFGSREDVNSVDLSGFDTVTDARQLWVTVAHAPGFGGPPSMVSDTDGITPERNRIYFLLRNGTWFSDFVENMDDEDPRKPPGDWVIRVEVIDPMEVCPDPQDPIEPLPDAAVEPPPRDMGQVIDVPDLGEIKDVPDMTPEDMPMVPPPDPDMSLPDPDMALPDPDMSLPDPDMTRPRPDANSIGLGTLAIERIFPAEGPQDRNESVVINGEGFPFGGEVEVKLGDTRLLEVEILSTSTITAIVPAGLTAGVHDLSVERDDGQIAILPQAYTVEGIGALTLSELEPSAIQRGEKPELQILGEGFDEQTTFLIGGARLQGVVLESSRRARGTLATSLDSGSYDLEAERGTETAILPGALTVLGSRGAASSQCGCRTPGRDTDKPPAALLLLLLLFRRRR